MDEAQLQHLILVLGHITSDVTVDWAEVAKIRGIGRKDNAATAFRSMIKKHGIEYANNKFTFVDNSVIANAKSENKAKPTTPRKRKPKANEEEGSEGKSESASPKKKQKGKKVVEVEKDTVGDEED